MKNTNCLSAKLFSFSSRKSYPNQPKKKWINQTRAFCVLMKKISWRSPSCCFSRANQSICARTRKTFQRCVFLFSKSFEEGNFHAIEITWSFSFSFVRRRIILGIFGMRCWWGRILITAYFHVPHWGMFNKEKSCDLKLSWLFTEFHNSFIDCLEFSLICNYWRFFLSCETKKKHTHTIKRKGGWICLLKSSNDPAQNMRKTSESRGRFFRFN